MTSLLKPLLYVLAGIGLAAVASGAMGLYGFFVGKPSLPNPGKPVPGQAIPPPPMTTEWGGGDAGFPSARASQNTRGPSDWIMPEVSGGGDRNRLAKLLGSEPVAVTPGELPHLTLANGNRLFPGSEPFPGHFLEVISSSMIQISTPSGPLIFHVDFPGDSFNAPTSDTSGTPSVLAR